MSEQGSEFDLNYVANLARLELSEEDVASFEPKLKGILNYMEKLDAVDVSGIEPTAHANQVLNVTRPDEVRPSLEPEEALRNAPKSANDQFVVPKVIE